MSNLDWDKLKSNPVLYICFLGLVATIVLWVKDENQDKRIYNNQEARITELVKENKQLQKDKDSIFKLSIEKQTIEKIIKDLNK